MNYNVLFRRYFQDRGILPSTVAANGIRISPPEETYKAVKALLPAIRWDYGDGYQRYRFLGDPDTFPRDEKGKPIKAKAIAGSGNRLYIPRRQLFETLEQQKLDPAIPLMIVEGEADCLGVLQAESGSLVVGISGCWGWKSKKDPILPELRELAKPGRMAVLCPDSDWQHNPQVFEGWRALGTALKQLGCNVQVVVIKSEPGNKLGAGDYIHRFGAETWVGLDRIPLKQWRIPHAKGKGTGDPDEDLGRKKPVAKVLIQLALELASLWHDSSGAGWVDFPADGIRQTARIRSKRFRDFLSRILWEREERSINSESWAQATGTLDGLARFNHPQREAFLRVGRHDGAVYIDLGSDDWRIIQVTATGWQIIPYSECPIRFYRPDCQLPLPIPKRGGSLENLWRLLNFKEADRPLVLGWLLSCLVPDGAKPILALSGEKGSGKSSAATLLKRLTDPTKVSKSGVVGDARQIASAAAGRWVLSFDNLSYLSTEQQDLLCCVSTGAGFSHRTLYTDLEETFLEYRRPQILTGVDLVPTRSDLLDRSLIVRLERIPEETRLPEAELEALTVELIPGIYGSLLDLLVTALRNLPTTNPAKLPRMADFAKLCIAAGIPDFLNAYAVNIQEGCQAAVEANPIAAGILSMLESVGGNWQGTATELVKKLQELDPTNRDFQKLSGDSLGRKLTRSLKTDLEAVGVVIDGIRTNKSRIWILTAGETPKKASQVSQVSQPSQDKASSSDTSKSKVSLADPEVSLRDPERDTSNGVSDTSQNKVSPPKPSQDKACDASDTCDTSLAAYLAAGNGNNIKPIFLDPSEFVEDPDEGDHS